MRSEIDLKDLSTEQRLALLDEIWDSLAADDVPVTVAQRSELDRRLDELDEDPSLGIPWGEVLRKIRER